MENDLDKILDVATSETKEMPSVNVISNKSTELQYSRTFNVHVPEAEELSVISASDMQRISDLCNKAKQNKFSFAELFLSISSLLIGACISALISKVKYELSPLSVILYNICPCLGLACGVIYFFCRRQEIDDARQLAEKIENYLEKYVEGSEKIE
ncbi:hypothetical protein SAMN04487833_10330 [Sarcina sp. DSM 11001]|uniref:hypothetical protein n=1 Tax=Sarcina sp. DSM 11001 TaxID=1798184 RepID=UPI000887AAF0|nr:hypothetical protein [Sarcina sp. DSM 11001]SDK44931.1 hypothetical protein SAMN04487833_10330 [Sarcina sp. DSM 11001]